MRYKSIYVPIITIDSLTKSFRRCENFTTRKRSIYDAIISANNPTVYGDGKYKTTRDNDKTKIENNTE